MTYLNLLALYCSRTSTRDDFIEEELWIYFVFVKL